MRTMLWSCVLGACLPSWCSAQDADGWVDILPGKNLAGWKRVPIAPDTKLNEKNAWSIDAKNKVLVCDGIGIKEMLLYDKELGDGKFRFEWRFRKVEGEPEYNSGVYFRTAADGLTWHQAQLAQTKKPPHVGDMFGVTDRGNPKSRIFATGDGHKFIKGPGEWNTYEVICQGEQITTVINGKGNCVWSSCPAARGRIGLQAELYYLEFKNLKFKELR